MQNVIVTSIRNETVLKSVVSGSVLIWCWVSGSVSQWKTCWWVSGWLLVDWWRTYWWVGGSVVGCWWVSGRPVGGLVVSGSEEDLSVGQWLAVGGGWPVGGW